MRIEWVAAWLLTLGLHTGVLLAVAWAVDRGAVRARPAWRELLWRVALFGGLVTATSQMVLDMPMATRFIVGRTETSIAAAQGTTRSITSETADRASTIRKEHNSPSLATAASTRLSVDETHLATESANDSSGLARLRAGWSGASWSTLLISAWLAGFLIVGLRLAFSWLRLERMLSHAIPLHDESIANAAAMLAIEARTPSPRLAVLDNLASPIAARGSVIALPRWALDLLDADQVRAMLAHETAHLARRDPAWKLLTAAWCSVLWFLPPVRLARRRLDEIAELACDAWAARHLGNGRSLAQCLAQCAERCAGFDSELAPAMAHRDSPLLQRIDHLIEGTPLNITLSVPRAAVAALLSLTFAGAILPGFAVSVATAQAAVSAPMPPAPPPPAPKVSTGSHVHISSDVNLFGMKRDFTRVEVNDGPRGYRARIDGKATFTDDGTEIASLDDGGKASFGETTAEKQRRVDYASHDGKIEQHYYVDDHEQPIDADARQWIGGIVAVVVRETALDADARVQRLHARGGASAVLDEIGRIQSGYARGVYIKSLAAIGKLSSADVTRAIGLIDPIDSDYERRNALSALAAAQPFDAQQQKLVLAQAVKIGSDYERAELLVGMLPTLAADPQLRAAWLGAASGISSDYEHRRTLSALLDQNKLDDATLAQLIDASRKIGSDYERRELLVATVRQIADADRIAVAYAAATAEIGSDYERREALMALIHAPKFGAAGAGAVLDATRTIGSDYECREVLVALANAMPNDTALIARYRDAARRLSDYERGVAERALDRFAG